MRDGHLPSWRLPVPALAAHRGGRNEGPENTLYAMAHGLAAGATHLEIDVRTTGDGQAVCIHDTTADRTCLEQGTIDRMSLDEVKALDPCALWSDLAGIAKHERRAPSGFTEAWFQVPTLDEVLANFPGVPVMIDLKDTAPPKAIAETVGAWGRTTDILLQGYDDDVLDATAALLPEVPRGAGRAGTEAFYLGEEVEADVICVPRTHEDIEMVDEGFVEAAHEQGKGFWVWTINEEAHARELMTLGVDGIITDVPTKLARLRRKRLEGT